MRAHDTAIEMIQFCTMDGRRTD